jgi:hypothetical protein
MTGSDINSFCANGHMGFQISLWQGDAVGFGRGATQTEIPVAALERFTGVDVKSRYAKGLSKNGIGSEQEIEPPAKIPFVGFGNHLTLNKRIELIQLKTIGLIGESNRSIEAI